MTPNRAAVLAALQEHRCSAILRTTNRSVVRPALEAAREGYLDVPVTVDVRHAPPTRALLDGLATTEAIRALQTPAADIKVILVTADVVNDTRKRALEVGVNEFASKPLQADDLQRALARCGLLDAAPAAESALEVARGARFGVEHRAEPVAVRERVVRGPLVFE